MGASITWLHLSDLHACKVRTGWDAHRIVAELERDLKHMQNQHGLRPDLIFFTGDAAYGQLGGGPGESLGDQFKEAAGFLQRVQTAFDPAVAPENVFLVPGNHDVDRKRAGDDQTLWLDSAATPDLVTHRIGEAGVEWKRYMERLQEYCRFFEAHGYGHILGDPDRLSYCVVRDLGGTRVAVAGLNSAWSCCREVENARLWMGGLWQIGQLEPELEKAEVRIALTHHPMGFGWLRHEEDFDVGRRIEGAFHFHLHGHQHRGWVDVKEGHTRIEAAACYERLDARKETGYNFVRLDLDAGRGEVWLREYGRQGAGGWVPMIVPGKTNNDGMWPLHSLPWAVAPDAGRGRPATPSPALTLTRYPDRRRPENIRTEADLLGAHAVSIPLVGREGELAGLKSWLDRGSPLSIRVLVGRAGSGKTRLALELCDRAGEGGWDAGFVPQGRLEHFLAQPSAPSWRWTKPALVVIDYAASRAGALRGWLVDLANAETPGGPPPGYPAPLRILLLERGADPSGGWWVEAFGLGGGDAAAVRRLLDPQVPVELAGLADVEKRRLILGETMSRAGGTLVPPRAGEDPYFDRRLAATEWAGQPLFLMMAGLLARHLGLGQVLALSRTDLAFHVADREIERMEGIGKEGGVPPQLASHLAAFATLCQGLSQDEAHDAFLGERPALGYGTQIDAPAVYQCLHAALPGEGGSVAPVAPDTVGEALLLRVLGRLSGKAGQDAVGRAAGLAGGRVIATVVRTAQDYASGGHDLPLAWLERLVRDGEGSLPALLEVEALLPQDTTALRGTCAEVSRSIVGILRQSGTPETKPLLAVSLNNLAVRMGDLGQRKEALGPAQEALEVRPKSPPGRGAGPAIPEGLTDVCNRIGGYLPLYLLIWYNAFDYSKGDWNAGKALGAMGPFRSR